MRKELNSKSKRKWIAGGIAAFASVALLTTGLATYIVGVSNTSVSLDGVKVNVDTAKNATLELAAALQENSTIVLAETEIPANNEGNFFRVEVDHEGQLVTTGNLNITFTTLEVRYGADSGFDKSDYQIDFAITKVNGVEGNPVYNYVSDPFGREGEKTYIEAPASIDLATAGSTLNETGTIKTLSLTNKVLSFRWGTAFEGNSPATFFNLKFNGDPALKTVANADACVAEINRMNDAFMVDEGSSKTNGQIVLTAKLTQKSAA